MTPIVHMAQIMLACVTVIGNGLLPVGQLSKETAKARNRCFRLYSQNYSKKFSRVPYSEDILNWELVSSGQRRRRLRKAGSGTPPKKGFYISEYMSRHRSYWKNKFQK